MKHTFHVIISNKKFVIRSFELCFSHHHSLFSELVNNRLKKLSDFIYCSIARRTKRV